MIVQTSDPDTRKATFDRDRFFYVMSEGWFFEAREGVTGPFGEKESALATLSQIKEESPQPRADVWQ